MVSPLTPGPDRFDGHVAAVDDGIAGQHPQGRRIARHLDIGILEYVFIPVEAFGFLIETGQGIDLHPQPPPGFPKQDRRGWSCACPDVCGRREAPCLYIASLAQSTIRFGDHIPGGGYLQAGSPDDIGHVRPDGARLVGEHNNLDTVVRHAFGHPLIGCHHTPSKILALTFDSQRAAAIPNPVSELGGWILTQPGNEKVKNFFVLYSIAIRRISNINIIVRISDIVFAGISTLY